MLKNQLITPEGTKDDLFADYSKSAGLLRLLRRDWNFWMCFPLRDIPSQLNICLN